MEEKTLLNAVLVFLVQGDYVLLARKKSKIGAGCWNGYGGGIEPDESIIAACERECFEESRFLLDCLTMRQTALIDFHNQKSDGTSFTCRVYVFCATGWDGVPEETVEMGQPVWFHIARLPLCEMMPADREWMPRMLEGEKLRAEFWYGPLQQNLIRPSLVRAVSRFDDE